MPVARISGSLGVLGLAVICALAGCLPTLPAGYAKAASSARTSYEQGRYAESAHHWTRAANAADKPKYRDEAIYRAALSFRRAGDTSSAIPLLDRLAQGSPGERKARATYDLALWQIHDGELQKGHLRLANAIRAFPDSGLAARSIRQYANWKLEHSDSDITARALQSFHISATRADESSRFIRAELLAHSGRLKAALQAYTKLLKLYPYPAGAYWDDASLRSAELQSALGHSKRAIAELKTMLSHRENANIAGSYDKSYAKAQYAIATEYVRSSQSSEALVAFEQLAVRFPNSRLSDDALWQAAELAKRLHLSERACTNVRRLILASPKSRYAHCANALCGSVPPNTRCADYVMRALSAASDDATSTDSEALTE